MRKFLTFIIVLFVQLGIIFGLYTWYVSGNSETEPAPTAQTVQKENSISGKNDKSSAPQKTEVAQSPIHENEPLPSVRKTESVKTKTAAATVPVTKKAEATQAKTQIDARPSIDSSSVKGIGMQESKPLLYRYTAWGNIPSLASSRLAKTGILVNIDDRRVLWAKNCRKPVPIASMTKMMTTLLAFEAINSNPNINLNTMIKVTNEAYQIGGSQVWLDPRESFTLKELLKSIMIKSANDSAYLVAQYLGGGDVANFVNKMNVIAKEIGMPNAHFSNPDGLPEKYAADDNKATAEGLIFLAEHLRQYPLAVKWASTKIAWFREGSKNPTMLVNTNHLIRDHVNGVNGMKTGYIKRFWILHHSYLH